MKKIAALFVSIALVVSLAGCKGNTATDTTGAGETTQKTETKTSEEKKEETQMEETIEKTIAGFDVSHMPEGGYTVGSYVISRWVIHGGFRWLKPSVR